MKVLVLDTGAILNYEVFASKYNLEEYELFTVPKVLEEVKSVQARYKLEILTSKHSLNTLIPQRRFKDIVKRIALKTGEMQLFTDTDIEVLALALQLKSEGYDVTLVSDDYHMLNVAEILGLKWNTIVQHGIKEVVYYVLVCPSCSYVCKAEKAYISEGLICPRCGNSMTLLRKHKKYVIKGRGKMLKLH